MPFTPFCGVLPQARELFDLQAAIGLSGMQVVSGVCSFVLDAVLVECPCSEDISDTSQEPSPPKAFAVTRCGSSHKPGVHMSPQTHGSDNGNNKGKLKACGKSPFSPEHLLESVWYITSGCGMEEGLSDHK